MSGCGECSAMHTKGVTTIGRCNCKCHGLTFNEFEKKYFPNTVRRREQGLIVPCPYCKGTGEVETKQVI